MKVNGTWRISSWFHHWLLPTVGSICVCFVNLPSVASKIPKLAEHGSLIIEGWESRDFLDWSSFPVDFIPEKCTCCSVRSIIERIHRMSILN